MKLGGSLERRRKGRAREPGQGLASVRKRVTEGRFVPAVLGMVLVGWALGYLVATRVLFPAPPPPGDLFSVPHLQGMDVATARAVLEETGLVLGSVDSIAHPTVTSALVVGQAPLPGQLALADTPVRVTVSTGPQTRSVPDVRGLVADQATVLLQASGFVVETDSVESAEPPGRVVEMRPGPGGVVTLPARVALSVSVGPPAIVMPLVLGMEEVAARVLLESLGLVVVAIEEVFRFGQDQGVVVEQEPAADTELPPGAEVRLGVGRRGG